MTDMHACFDDMNEAALRSWVVYDIKSQV